MTDPDEEMTILPALQAYKATAPLAFVAPAVGSIEAKAVQRRRRRIVATSVASVALAGLAGVLLAGNLPFPGAGKAPVAETTPSIITSQQTPPPSASTAPSPSASQGSVSGPRIDAALLSAEDVGPGHIVDPEPEPGDWSLWNLSQFCDALTDRSFAGPEPVRKERVIEGPRGVVQAVSVGDGGYGSWEIGAIRELVNGCPELNAYGYPHSLSIIAEDFAGEESILVKDTYKPAGAPAVTVHYAFVRQGDVVTQIRFNDHTMQQMTDIAQKAAARLCEVTDAC